MVVCIDILPLLFAQFLPSIVAHNSFMDFSIVTGYEMSVNLCICIWIQYLLSNPNLAIECIRCNDSFSCCYKVLVLTFTVVCAAGFELLKS